MERGGEKTLLIFKWKPKKVEKKLRLESKVEIKYILHKKYNNFWETKPNWKATNLSRENFLFIISLQLNVQIGKDLKGKYLLITFLWWYV